MANVKNSVWFGELDRFGYVLQVVGRTEKEARDALIAEYVRVYKDINNGSDPRKDEWYDGESYYDNAIEDMNITEMAFGKVEWA